MNKTDVISNPIIFFNILTCTTTLDSDGTLSLIVIY